MSAMQRTAWRRISIVATVIAAAIMFPVPSAHAAFWTVEATWYKSIQTCNSRGLSLLEAQIILSWDCTYNNGVGEYPDRYTLNILKHQPGDPIINGMSSDR